ncbi:MAG TPA: methyltransferase domain-containing protein [Gemmatimonadaceae bacterium]|nr:methyltransferase domain-containing protein [Gemmatimonadaceae bacterium]
MSAREHAGDEGGHGHKFPAEKWERLVSPERQSLLVPDRLLEQFGVHEGMTVADLGAGPGFFTFPLATRVGAAGLVYATDISPEMLSVLESRGLPPQIRPILAGESRIPIPDGIVDLALLAFVLHELVHPEAFLHEVRRILRPTGRLVVLEWQRREEEMGPPMHERLSQVRSAALLAAGGFIVSEDGEANASQYYLVARPERPEPAHP